MSKYTQAPVGKRFALTEFGLEQSHVRCKYEADALHRARYEQKVPTTWIERGYVQLIQKGGYDED